MLNMVTLLRGHGRNDPCADGMRQPFFFAVRRNQGANCRTPACGSVICDGLSSQWRTTLFSNPFKAFVMSHIAEFVFGGLVQVVTTSA